jgi:hypothetical protein
VEAACLSEHDAVGSSVPSDHVARIGLVFRTDGNNEVIWPPLVAFTGA